MRQYHTTQTALEYLNITLCRFIYLMKKHKLKRVDRHQSRVERRFPVEEIERLKGEY